jgi:hypothetical protein
MAQLKTLQVSLTRKTVKRKEACEFEENKKHENSYSKHKKGE